MFGGNPTNFQTPGTFMTPTPGAFTPGQFNMLASNQTEKHGSASKGHQGSGLHNLYERINDYHSFVSQGDINEQIIVNNDRPVISNELEIFLNGGGNGCQQYRYKKAALDFSKMQGSADGALMLRVNCPVTDG